jgi:hypothetical protein
MNKSDGGDDGDDSFVDFLFRRAKKFKVEAIFSVVEFLRSFFRPSGDRSDTISAACPKTFDAATRS